VSGLKVWPLLRPPHPLFLLIVSLGHQTVLLLLEVTFSLYVGFVDEQSMYVWVVVTWFEEFKSIFSYFSCNNDEEFPSFLVFCVFLPSRPVLSPLNCLVQSGVEVDNWVTKCYLIPKSSLWSFSRIVDLSMIYGIFSDSILLYFFNDPSHRMSNYLFHSWLYLTIFSCQLAQ